MKKVSKKRRDEWGMVPGRARRESRVIGIANTSEAGRVWYVEEGRKYTICRLGVLVAVILPRSPYVELIT